MQGRRSSPSLGGGGSSRNASATEGQVRQAAAAAAAAAAANHYAYASMGQVQQHQQQQQQHQQQQHQQRGSNHSNLKGAGSVVRSGPTNTPAGNGSSSNTNNLSSHPFMSPVGAPYGPPAGTPSYGNVPFSNTMPGVAAVAAAAAAASPGSGNQQQQHQHRLALQLKIQQQQLQLQQLQHHQQQLQANMQRSVGSVAAQSPTLSRPTILSPAQSPSSNPSILMQIPQAPNLMSPSRNNSEGGSNNGKGSINAMLPPRSSPKSANASLNSLLMNQQPRQSSNIVNMISPPPLVPPPASRLHTSSSSTTVSKIPQQQQKQHSNSLSSPLSKTNEISTLQLLSKCDWREKTLWVSRQLLGGNAVNGFLKATSAVQRIKKQRQRQATQAKVRAAAAATTANTTNPDDNASIASGGQKKDPVSSIISTDQASEEAIKKEIFNPRVAKKMKTELEAGVQFCALMQSTIRSILIEVDPTLVPYLPPPIHEPLPNQMLALPPKLMALAAASSAALANTTSGSSRSSNYPPSAALQRRGEDAASTASAHSTSTSGTQLRHAQQHPVSLMQQQQQQRKTSFKSAQASMANDTAKLMSGTNINKNNAGRNMNNSLSTFGNNSSTVAAPGSATITTTSTAGNPSGSTLRRNRKKKLPPSDETKLVVPEYDEANDKRLFSKKEHSFRFFDLLRFRRIKPGDYVAARTTSRDLWILAKVLQDYPSGWEKLAATSPAAGEGKNSNSINNPIALLEFMQMSETRRDALFRDENVLIKDAEEKDDVNSKGMAIPRNLILPLPRSYSEASEWGSKYKKGFRVYAMYPMTTSLYSASIIDCTTYCRGDDDIIVVEFDGEEPDSAGKVPQYHIPARFVIMIPKEFNVPTKQNVAAASNNNSKKRRVSSAEVLAIPASGPPLVSAGAASTQDGLKRMSMGSQHSGSSNVGNRSSRVTHRRGESSDDALNDMLNALADDKSLDNYEFDLGFVDNEELPPPSGMHM